MKICQFSSVFCFVSLAGRQLYSKVPPFKKLHRKKLRPDFAELDTSRQETIQADSCSVSFTIALGNILWHMFE